MKQIYSATPYLRDNVNDINPADLQLMIDDQLFFEMLLLEIRGQTISYASKCKRNRLNVEKDLDEKIKSLERKVHVLEHDHEDKDKVNEIMSLLQQANRELENLRDKNLNGTLIRSKARWVEKGEKPTKYFLNLEKRNFVNKQMQKIVIDNGKTVFKQNEITNEVVKFYSDLYSVKNDVDVDPDLDSINNLPFKKLTDEQSNRISGQISLDELSISLKKYEKR